MKTYRKQPVDDGPGSRCDDLAKALKMTQAWSVENRSKSTINLPKTRIYHTSLASKSLSFLSEFLSSKEMHLKFECLGIFYHYSYYSGGRERRENLGEQILCALVFADEESTGHRRLTRVAALCGDPEGNSVRVRPVMLAHELFIANAVFRSLVVPSLKVWVHFGFSSEPKFF